MSSTSSMSQPNPRKRPAPGAGSILPLQQFPQTFNLPQQDQIPRWSSGAVSDAANFTNPASQDVASFMMSAPNQSPTTQGFQPVTSNAIARRPNRALIPSARAPFDTATDAWSGFGDDAALVQASNSAPVHEHDNIALLEEKAARAKREAQANRKQIPPFVQKLSSFLEEQKNTDLIRWSEKGDSFIVLDEDEFAKTLIPELFKHNNYASFVRQLNMYGFHKRVGLSDNSMKASERKNKSPSEYYNPYFKRGHPNLLWLINKPKSGVNKNKKGKKEDGDGDSEEEAVPADDGYAPGLVGPGQGGHPPGVNAAGHRNHPGNLPGDLGTLQRKDLQLVKDQLGQIQQQQKAISALINRLRQDHNQLYQQAMAFQSMHERHENSINAILNFLANVFRKSLEEQGGPQSVSDLLASIIPNGSSQVPQGSVFDLGDVFHHQQPTAMGDRATTVSPPKRPQRLLPPIPTSGGGRVSTVASSPATTAAPSPYTGGLGQMGSVTELFDSNSPSDTTSSPSYLKNELRNNPQEGMMKIINNHNAGNPSAASAGGIDLSDVAAKTQVTMSSDQRSKMLSMMAATQPPTASTLAAAAAAAATPVSSGFPTPSFPAPSPSSATTTTTMPPPPSAAAAATATTNTTMPPPAPSNSLSPIMSTNSLSPIISSMPPPPSLHDISMTEAELEALQRLQDDQRSKIDSLSHFLGPLSPSGRIPGIDENGNPTTGTHGDGYFPDGIDIDQFLDPSAFASSVGFDSADFGGVGGTGAGGATDDFHFSLDGTDYDTSGGAGTGAGAHLPLGGHVIETSSADTPSDAATEDIFRHDLAESPLPDNKRRRIG